MSELWAEYDANGNPIEVSNGLPQEMEKRSQSYTTIAAVYLYHRVKKTESNPTGLEVLLQKRSIHVENANLFDVSAGGHTDFIEKTKSAEEPIDAVLRETKEELGVKLEKSKLVEIFRHTDEKYRKHRVIFMYEWKNLENSIRPLFDENFDFHLNYEVASTKWIPLSGFEKFVGKHAKNAVRFSPEITEVVNYLKKI